MMKHRFYTVNILHITHIQMCTFREIAVLMIFEMCLLLIAVIIYLW